jgi:hypothetical protein
MAESNLPRPQIDARLEALYEEVGHFPANVYCPGPLARIFNQLLAHAKRELAGDPIVSAIRSLDESDVDDTGANNRVLAGTVRGLIRQVRVALAQPGEPDGATPPARKPSSRTAAAKAR